MHTGHLNLVMMMCPRALYIVLSFFFFFFRLILNANDHLHLLEAGNLCKAVWGATSLIWQIGGTACKYMRFFHLAVSSFSSYS